LADLVKVAAAVVVVVVVHLDVVFARHLDVTVGVNVNVNVNVNVKANSDLQTQVNREWSCCEDGCHGAKRAGGARNGAEADTLASGLGCGA